VKLAAGPRILIVAGLCAAALIGLVVSEGFARQGGQEITLPMAAVDPRSLLSGHYVQLNFTEQLEPDDVCPQAGNGEWLALRPDGDIHVLAGAAPSLEQAQLIGPLPVKGSFQCSAPTPPNPSLPEGLPGWLQLDLGVGRFHINQTDALRIEQVLREQRTDQPTRAFAVLSVGRDGRARLRALVIDGERFELNWF
jgi:hypothetical protein